MAKSKKPKNEIVLFPLNDSQKSLINSINVYPMTITIGPAGTGKSYLTSYLAAKALKDKTVSNIIITRPTVPSGRSIGYFPGNLNEKMLPWCLPILGSIEEFLGKGDFEYHMKAKNIELVPFETIRGRSFENCFVILDEAQNCTKEEVKVFVTRIGEYSKAVINGDLTQSDIGSHNGLKTLLSLLKTHKGLQKYVGLVEFSREDIVRSGLCQMWVEAFDFENEASTEGIYQTLGIRNRNTCAEHSLNGQ